MSVPPTSILRQTFRKAEKLCSRKKIETLVESGKVISIPPYRLSWITESTQIFLPAQIAFAVPKKKIRSAVDRNRVKRMMREVYRKNKNLIYPLLTDAHLHGSLLMVYTGSTVPEFAQVTEKITLILQRLAQQIQENIR